MTPEQLEEEKKNYQKYQEYVAKKEEVCKKIIDLIIENEYSYEETDEILESVKKHYKRNSKIER